LVGGADVRQALLLVERGDADAGIVYATDARKRDKVRVVADIDSQLHEPIRYPLVLVKRTKENPAAERFFDLLSGPAGAKVFRKYGFTMLDSPPTSKAGNEPPR
jgi:molybdate transport system substrate-binding protein